MKATWSKLKNLKFLGRRIPWAEQRIDEYTKFLDQEYPDLARRLDKTPFAKFHGSPHETEKTNDPWHASVALRRKEDFKGSGLSLHVYPDGTIVPSKSEFPTIQVSPATEQEVGSENSQWLDPEFVASWQEANRSAGSSAEEGKGKSKAESKKGKGKLTAESTRSRSHGSSSKGNNADSSQYSRHPQTGQLYRYAADGTVVYLDPRTKKEYCYDDEGEAVWL